MANTPEKQLTLVSLQCESSEPALWSGFTLTISDGRKVYVRYERDGGDGFSIHCLTADPYPTDWLDIHDYLAKRYPGLATVDPDEYNASEYEAFNIANGD